MTSWYQYVGGSLFGHGGGRRRHPAVVGMRDAPTNSTHEASKDLRTAYAKPSHLSLWIVWNQKILTLRERGTNKFTCHFYRRAVPRCREGWRTQAGPEPGRTLWTTQRNNGWIQLLQGQHRRQGYVGRGYVVRLPAEPEEVHAGNENGVCGTEEAAGARRSDRLHEERDGVRKRAQQANV